MNRYYPHLFEPIKIGSLSLKNRIVASVSSQNDIEPDGTLSLHNIAYYARKAQGGASLVTVGDGIVHPTGKDHPNQVYLFTDRCLPSLTRCAEEIHKYGAAASYELSHGGIVCNPEFINGERPYGPSEMDVTIGFQTVNPVIVRSQEMTEEFMDEIADAYAAAAKRCQKAGFDMVMVHAAHGWLIGQFFSPHTNHRTDKYGGSIENRTRFAIMVLERILKAVGPRFPIEIRMNGRDGLDPYFNSLDGIDPDAKGLELEDACKIAGLLDPYVDSFHISQCFHMYPAQQDIMQTTIFMPRGHNLYLGEEIKRHVTKPVTTVGGFCDLDVMERTIAAGKVDMIALGRQMLADPDIAVKGMEGKKDQVRKCLRCANCQSGRFERGTARCSLNPEIGREYELQFDRAVKPEPKKVLVAGGGPAGMQAAITACRQGHDVTLYEKEDRLGGALNFAEFVDFKSEVFQLIRTLEAELKSLPVKVVMKTALTPEIAEKEQADVIISAMGADTVKPPFPGKDLPNVLMAADADRGGVNGDKIVVVGGGLVGVETALHMAREGKKVTILEMAPNFAQDANIRYSRTYRWELAKEGVEVLCNTCSTAFTEQGVCVKDMQSGEERLIECDAIVIAAGMRPREEASEALRWCAKTFIPIGNVVKPGIIMAAIRSGFDAAMYQIR